MHLLVKETYDRESTAFSRYSCQAGVSGFDSQQEPGVFLFSTGRDWAGDNCESC